LLSSLKKDKEKTEIIFLGRYNTGEILTGPEKVAKRIFNEFTKEKKSVFIEYFFDGREYNRYKKLFGFEKVCNVNGSEVFRLGIIRLLIFIITARPKVIHIITNERFPSVVFFLKRVLNFKVIYNVHSIFLYEYENLLWKISASLLRKERKVEKIFIQKSDLLLFLDKKSLKIAKYYYKVRDNKIAFIKNGVDKVFFEIGRIKKINSTGKLKIIFGGNTKRGQKGFEFLINSIRKSEHKFELFIIGDPKDSIGYSSSRIEIKIVDKMDTASFAKFLSDKDVIITSSFYDSFSIVSAEAMAAGLACILTKETGLSELLHNGIDGIIIDYGNEKSLNDSLEKLINDRAMLENLSINGRTFSESLKWTNIFGDYKKAYTTLGINF
jgi:glycosyltransferase involved in cell wall biosynthesis